MNGYFLGGIGERPASGSDQLAASTSIVISKSETPDGGDKQHIHQPGNSVPGVGHALCDRVELAV
jgi:hypothetical protein